MKEHYISADSMHLECASSSLRLSWLTDTGEVVESSDIDPCVFAGTDPNYHDDLVGSTIRLGKVIHSKRSPVKLFWPQKHDARMILIPRG
jgi:hypothetical protein